MSELFGKILWSAGIVLLLVSLIGEYAEEGAIDMSSPWRIADIVAVYLLAVTSPIWFV